MRYNSNRKSKDSHALSCGRVACILEKCASLRNLLGSAALVDRTDPLGPGSLAQPPVLTPFVQAGGPYLWYLLFRAKPGSVPCPYPSSRGTEALFQTGYSLTWIRKRARGNRARLTPSRPVGSCCRNRLNSPRIGIFRRHRHFDFYRK